MPVLCSTSSYLRRLRFGRGQSIIGKMMATATASAWSPRLSHSYRLICCSFLQLRNSRRSKSWPFYLFLHVSTQWVFLQLRKTHFCVILYSRMTTKCCHPTNATTVHKTVRANRDDWPLAVLSCFGFRNFSNPGPGWSSLFLITNIQHKLIRRNS